MTLPIILVALLLSWTFVCVTVGLIWAEHERRKAERNEYDARDRWAEDYQRRNGAI